MRELTGVLIEKEQSERQFKLEVGSFVRDRVFKRTFKGLFFEKYEG